MVCQRHPHRPAEMVKNHKCKREDCQDYETGVFAIPDGNDCPTEPDRTNAGSTTRTRTSSTAIPVDVGPPKIRLDQGTQQQANAADE